MPKPTKKMRTPLPEAATPDSTHPTEPPPPSPVADPFRLWKAWQPSLHTYLLSYFEYKTIAELLNHLQTATAATSPKLCHILKEWDTHLPIFNAIVRHHIFPDSRTLVAIEKALQISPPDKISPLCKSAPTPR